MSADRPVGRRGGRLLPAVYAALALAWLLLPLLPLLGWGVADRWSAPALVPQEVGVRGWEAALDAGVVGAGLRSLALGIVVAALATPLGAMAGRVLGWGETRHRLALAVVLLLPVLLPPFAVSMGLDVLLLRARVPGVVATVAVLATFALPYCAFTVAAGYARLDRDVEEQARSLGASPRQARWRATLPAVRRPLLVAAVLAFLVGWSDYVVTLLLGGGRLLTLPVLLGSAASGAGNEPAVAALGVATAAPPVLILVLAGLLLRRRGTKSRREGTKLPREGTKLRGLSRGRRTEARA